jgi:hypothetical protein
MIIAQACLFGLITALYAFVIRKYSRNGWIRAKILAISTSLYLFLLILIFLWYGIFEAWIIRVGFAFSFLVGCAIWSFPFIDSESAKKFHIQK